MRMTDNKEKKCCGNCIYWDYKHRIMAKLSNGVRAGWARGVVELRSCRWEAHPSVDVIWWDICTDENFCCCEFVKNEN